MRKFLVPLLVSGLLFVGMPVMAQFFTTVSLMTPHYYPGEVYFTDGHSEQFAEVELPMAGKDKIAVKKEEGDKNRQDINAIDIVGVKIWHKNFPDKVHTLYYVHAKKALMQGAHQWGYPVEGSAWGVLYRCEIYYKIEKKTGDMSAIKYVGGTGPDTPTLFYLKRPRQDEATLVITDRQFAVKKKVAELFKENENIYNGIKSGKLKPKDMQYILNEMAGGEPAEMDVLLQDNTPQVEHTENGTIGDDE